MSAEEISIEDFKPGFKYLANIGYKWEEVEYPNQGFSPDQIPLAIEKGLVKRLPSESQQKAAPLPAAPDPNEINISMDEFKRYMSHAYFVGAVDNASLCAAEEPFNLWFNGIKKPQSPTPSAAPSMKWVKEKIEKALKQSKSLKYLETTENLKHFGEGERGALKDVLEWLSESPQEGEAKPDYLLFAGYAFKMPENPCDRFEAENSDVQIEFTLIEGGWKFTNGVDGWGRNLREQYKNEPVIPLWSRKD